MLFVSVCILLAGAQYATAQVGEGFEATSLFEVAANSTCGDPPSTFVYRGEVLNCSTGDHTILFAFDNDAATWWQSGNGADAVSINFTLEVIVIWGGGHFGGRGIVHNPMPNECVWG